MDGYSIGPVLLKRVAVPDTLGYHMFNVWLRFNVLLWLFADDFFGRPEVGHNSVNATRMPTKCNSGLLALKVTLRDLHRRSLFTKSMQAWRSRGCSRNCSLISSNGPALVQVPDPPQFAPSAVCAISADGKIAAVGGRDIELFLWDVDTGDLLSKIRGHDIFWVGSHDNAFFITCQEDGKVRTRTDTSKGLDKPCAVPVVPAEAVAKHCGLTASADHHVGPQHHAHHCHHWRGRGGHHVLPNCVRERLCDRGIRKGPSHGSAQPGSAPAHLRIDQRCIGRHTARIGCTQPQRPRSA